jgi:hypothetical protein
MTIEILRIPCPAFLDQRKDLSKRKHYPNLLKVGRQNIAFPRQYSPGARAPFFNDKPIAAR